MKAHPSGSQPISERIVTLLRWGHMIPPSDQQGSWTWLSLIPLSIMLLLNIVWVGFAGISVLILLFALIGHNYVSQWLMASGWLAGIASPLYALSFILEGVGGSRSSDPSKSWLLKVGTFWLVAVIVGWFLWQGTLGLPFLQQVGQYILGISIALGGGTALVPQATPVLVRSVFSIGCFWLLLVVFGIG